MPGLGLLGRSFTFLPGEDPAAFADECASLVSEWQAHSAREADLVELMVIQRWRLMRAQSLEAELHQDRSGDPADRARRLAAFGRYLRGIEQSQRQALQDLERIKRLEINAERLKIERMLIHGFPGEFDAMAGEGVSMPVNPAGTAPIRPAAPGAPSPSAPAPASSIHLNGLNRSQRRRQAALERKQQRRSA